LLPVRPQLGEGIETAPLVSGEIVGEDAVDLAACLVADTQAQSLDRGRRWQEKSLRAHDLDGGG